MTALLDVNVLISLLDVDHPGHSAAKKWFEAHHADGWSTCPITQNGCVRIMSAVSYSNPLPVNDVVKRLAEATNFPHHHFWPDDVSILDSDVADLSRIQGSKQLTDLYLLALAVKNSGRFVTRDTSIPVHAVKGARPEHLVVI